MTNQRRVWETLWHHAHLATMEPGEPYGAIRDGAIATGAGRIVWTGRSDELAPPYERLANAVHDAGGAWITPGLIDPHTHLVYAGNRAREFEQRLQGRTYEEIARAGGGILSTVEATRRASEAELLTVALRRLRRLAARGVTTIEIKSGYGLDALTEVRMLRAARRLATHSHVRVCTTYLGLHAVPPEFREDPDAYVDLVCEHVLPTIAQDGLADAVDAFCERIAFTAEQTARFFTAANAVGLSVKLHADQLSDGGGAALAARMRALSADHLEHTDDGGVAALAASGVTAVLLPAATYVLRETRLPPVAALRAAGVPIAIASDSNPGTAPILDPLLVLNMACTLLRLTPEEALTGMTRNAARALGLDDVGVLRPGTVADFVLWEVEHPSELAYAIGADPALAVVKDGTLVIDNRGASDGNP